LTLCPTRSACGRRTQALHPLSPSSICLATASPPCHAPPTQARKGEKSVTLLADALLEALAAARSSRAQQPVPLSPGVAIAASPSANGAAPLWAPVGLGGGHAWGGTPLGAPPFTPDSAAVTSALPRLTPASSIRGFAPPASQPMGGGDGGGGGSLFGSAGGDGGSIGDELKSLTPMFAGARWGSGIGAPGSAGGGAPVPALQPLVGSFSMGTGLGLGTLLRGFGTDADASGLGGGDDAGHADAPLFGTPLPHAPFGAGGGGGGDGDGLLFSGMPSSLGANGLPLGSSALDLVPRSIASVWGAPGPSPAGAAPQQPPPPPPQRGDGGGAAGGAAGAPQGGGGEPAPADRPGALSNSSSSGLLSVRGNAGGAIVDSSVPDTEGTASPLSATGSEPRGSGVGGKAPPAGAPAETAVAAVPAAPAIATAATEAPGDAALDSVGDASLEGEEPAASEEHGDDTAADAAAAEAPRKLTGWALVAAKTPPKPQRGAPAHAAASAPRSAPAPKEQHAAGAAGAAGGLAGALAAGGARRPDAARAPLARLHPGVREEVERLIERLGGVVRVRGGGWAAGRAAAGRWGPGAQPCNHLPTGLTHAPGPTSPSPQVEDFDEGVVHQLNAKKNWEEAADAVKHLATYDLAAIQHPAGGRGAAAGGDRRRAEWRLECSCCVVAPQPPLRPHPTPCTPSPPQPTSTTSSSASARAAWATAPAARSARSASRASPSAPRWARPLTSCGGRRGARHAWPASRPLFESALTLPFVLPLAHPAHPPGDAPQVRRACVPPRGGGDCVVQPPAVAPLRRGRRQGAPAPRALHPVACAATRPRGPPLLSSSSPPSQTPPPPPAPPPAPPPRSLRSWPSCRRTTCLRSSRR
jgi:hypothetical protein